MKDVLPDIERWRARASSVCIATVVATRRSAPRPVGSKLAVSESGELAGSVSGGCVESRRRRAGRARCSARRRRRGSSRTGSRDDQAWSVGLPCGGEIDVFVERARLSRASSGSARSSRPASAPSCFTVVEGEALGREAARAGRAARPSATARRSWPSGADALILAGRSRMLEQPGRKVFADVFGPPPRLLVIGAIDTAEALCARGGPARLAHDRRPTRAAAFATPRAHPERRRAARRLARRGARAGAARPRDRDRRPHARRQVRPARAAGRARDRGASTSARSARAATRRGAASGCSRTASRRPTLDRISGPCGLDLGADTPGRDGALDPGRDPRRARRAARAAACATRRRRIHVEPPGRRSSVAAAALASYRTRRMLLREVEYARPGSVEEALGSSAANPAARAARRRADADQRDEGADRRARRARRPQRPARAARDPRDRRRPRARRDGHVLAAHHSPRGAPRRGRSSPTSPGRSPTSRCATAARSAATSARTTRPTTCRR